MASNPAIPSDESASYIAAVGLRVRQRREAQRLSRRELTELSGVSQRYLAQLELGSGNISIGLLRQIADALECRVADFIEDPVDCAVPAQLERLFAQADPSVQRSVLEQLSAGSTDAARAQRVALIGLRGAGKSTLGAALAERNGAPFVELDALITERTGLGIADVMAVNGPDGYRQFERDALFDFIDANERAVVAVAGGVVADRVTFSTLLARCHTVWIKADSASHMARVRRQGDLRPMDGHPEAMTALNRLLGEREPFYAQADRELETTGQFLNVSAEALHALVSDAGWLHTSD